MTTQMKRTSFSATAGVAVLLGALLAGCSSGASTEEFCSDYQKIDGISPMDDVDPADKDAVKKVVDDMVAQIEDVQAPEEIADDWDVIQGISVQILEAVTADDPEAAMEELTERMEADETTAASEKIDSFVTENCTA